MLCSIELPPPAELTCCVVSRLPYLLVLLSKVASSVIEFAKSQLEWMNADVAVAFERDRDNPFHLRSRGETVAGVQVTGHNSTP